MLIYCLLCSNSFDAREILIFNNILDFKKYKILHLIKLKEHSLLLCVREFVTLHFKRMYMEEWNLADLGKTKLETLAMKKTKTISLSSYSFILLNDCFFPMDIGRTHKKLSLCVEPILVD